MSNEDATQKSLEEIKNLLILLLLKFGATSEELGYALNIDSSRIRQMFPIKKIKKINEST